MTEPESWTFQIKPYDEATHDRERHGEVAARYVRDFKLRAPADVGTFVSAVEQEDGSTAVTYSVPVVPAGVSE